MITKRELSKQLTALAAETGRQISTLREDMAAEFVKRDDTMDEHAFHIEGFRKCLENWAKDLEKLDTLALRLEGVQESLIMDRLFIRGLMKAVGLTETQKEIASRYASAKFKEYKKGEPLYTEPKMEKEADLFSQAEEQPKKRSRKDIKDEAFARNLISLDALRIRYGVSKDTINAAAAYLGLKLHAIEGSKCKYISRSKIGEISDYLKKA